MTATSGVAASSESVFDREAYTWSFSGAPITVRLDLSLVDAIRRDLDQSIFPVAVLLGTVIDRTVHITGMHRIPALTQSGVASALAVVAKSDKGVPVGILKTQAKGALALSPADTEIAEQCLRDPHAVVLLVQAGAPPNATFFFREAGRFFGEFAFLDFPFDSGLLKLEAKAAQARRPEETVAATDSEDAPSETRPPSRFGIGRVLAVAACALLLAVAAGIGIWAWMGGWPRRDASRTEQAEATTPRNDFGLRAERSGQDFVLTWDRNAPAIKSAAGGVLSIEDGANKREIPLDVKQIQRGSVVFQPVNDRVQIQLSLAMPGGVVNAESVLLLLAAGGSKSAAQPRIIPVKPKPAAAGTIAPAVQQSSPAAEAVSPPPVPEGTAEPAPQTRVDVVTLPQRSAPITLDGMDFRSAAPPSAPPSKTAAGAAIPVQPARYRGPVPISQATPSMSAALRAMIVRETSVDVKVTIDQKGAVTNARTVTGPGSNTYFGTIAEQAARQWRFRPATKDGNPSPSEWTIRFVFKPQ